MIATRGLPLVSMACLLEASARKAGNVHSGADFHDTSFVDFLMGSAALGHALTPERVRAQGVGRSVLEAIRMQRALVDRNTHLGIALLLAPLLAVPEVERCRTGVERVLDGLTVDDAVAVYEAIRLAAPGGLGRAEAQDVHAEPTLPLRAVMRLAAERDLIARQYAGGYAELFDTALPSLERWLAGEPLETSIVGCHLELMARFPDTLIARKCSRHVAEEAARSARAVLAAGWPRSPAGQAAFNALDQWLRAQGSKRNPGATADLVATTLYVALREGTIALPLPAGSGFLSLAPA